MILVYYSNVAFLLLLEFSTPLDWCHNDLRHQIGNNNKIANKSYAFTMRVNKPTMDCKLGYILGGANLLGIM